MRVKKRHAVSTVIIILIFLVGLSLLLYPTVSEYFNSRHQSHVIEDYASQVDQTAKENRRKLWQEAEEFNQELAARPFRTELSEAMTERYNEVLNSSGNGVMGYLEIPSIDCRLAIYHGTDEEVLQVAIGHLEWSSLPVGGEGTHSVISGHRGLPSAELLTNIDRMEKGDVFYIHVLGETLTYRVDQIAVVEPTDVSLLRIEEGRDYVTLLTCTPYGINSHRLLVRGTRINAGGEPDAQLQLSGEVRELNVFYPVAGALLGIVVAAFLVLLIVTKQKKKKGGKRLLEKDKKFKRW